MTRSELLEVIYRFYPRGLWPDDLGFADTEELGEHVEQHAPPSGSHRVDEVHALLVEVLAADRDAALEL